MRGTDAFQHKLRRRLLVIAQARRCACANQPSGSDLKAIAHCEWLAASVEELSPRLCAAVTETLADPATARRFAALWDELPEALGTTVWPRDANELTANLLRDASLEATPSRRTRIASAPAKEPHARDHTASSRLTAAVAGDFTGGLAVVAPMLAVWQVAVGLRQWHQAAFAARHPATLARIDALSPSAAGRDAASSQSAIVTFTPEPGAVACRARVDLDRAAAVGTMVQVVPRSPVCETPLLVASIGDPAASFALAALFAVTGVASLKAWSWLGRGTPHGTPVARSARTVGLAL